jgi:hypothetical protein
MVPGSCRILTGAMSLPPPPPRRPRAPGPGPEPRPPDPTARATGRVPQRRSSRWRGVLLGLGAIAGVAILAVVVLVVTGGGDSKPPFKGSTSVKLVAGTTTTERVTSTFEPAPELPAEVQDQVLAVLTRYVDEGIVAPLQKGAAAETALAEIFDAAAVTRLAGADRAVVLDEGFPKADRKVDVTTPAVTMTGLANADGNLVFVSASVDLKITAKAAAGDTVRIQRAGSFVLAPDPTTGWKITAWTLHVDRVGPGVTPPAGAATPSTTAVKP